MFRNIQMLRAIAAILVFFHHAVPHYDAMNGNMWLLKTVGKWGFTGVEIFFVISGFVIAHTTLSKERSLPNAIEFIKHRLLRIYLGYWPFLAIYFFIILNVEPGRIPGLSLVDSIFLTSTDIFKLVLPVAWSLSYEIYFYGLFLLSFALSAAATKKLIVLIGVGLLARHLLLPASNNAAMSFLFSECLIEFFAGATIYICLKWLDKPWLVPITAGIAVVCYSIGMMLHATNGPVRIYTFGTGAACIVIAALAMERSHFYRAGSMFVQLGDASYTIYLGHLTFLAIFYLSGVRTFLSGYGHPIIELGFLAFIATSLIFSVMIYRYFEKPLYKFVCSVRFAQLLGFIKPERRFS